MPEKSGMADVSSAALSAGPLAGVAVCARAGITAAKENNPIDVRAITVIDVMTYPYEVCKKS
jgi:hypothetical protein